MLLLLILQMRKLRHGVRKSGVSSLQNLKTHRPEIQASKSSHTLDRAPWVLTLNKSKELPGNQARWFPLVWSQGGRIRFWGRELFPSKTEFGRILHVGITHHPCRSNAKSPSALVESDSREWMAYVCGSICTDSLCRLKQTIVYPRVWPNMLFVHRKNE